MTLIYLQLYDCFRCRCISPSPPLAEVTTGSSYLAAISDISTKLWGVLVIMGDFHRAFIVLQGIASSLMPCWLFLMYHCILQYYVNMFLVDSSFTSCMFSEVMTLALQWHSLAHCLCDSFDSVWQIKLNNKWTVNSTTLTSLEKKRQGYLIALFCPSIYMFVSTSFKAWLEHLILRNSWSPTQCTWQKRQCQGLWWSMFDVIWNMKYHKMSQWSHNAFSCKIYGYPCLSMAIRQVVAFCLSNRSELAKCGADPQKHRVRSAFQRPCACTSRCT